MPIKELKKTTKQNKTTISWQINKSCSYNVCLLYWNNNLRLNETKKSKVSNYKLSRIDNENTNTPYL